MRLELRGPEGDVPADAPPVTTLECRGDIADPDEQAVYIVEVGLEELLACLEVATEAAGKIHTFDDCELHTGTRSLTRAGRTVHLRPKVYRLLVHLIEHRHRAVSRDELCDAVWNGRCVGNATVDSTVKALRHAVGDDGDAQRVIRTLSGYGYRFVAPAESSTATGAAPHGATPRTSGHERLRIRLGGPRTPLY